MPCVAILRDRLYDIVITTDDEDKIRQLYDLGAQLDASEEDQTDFNINIFRQVDEFHITSQCVIFKNEANFIQMFPNREAPMLLTLEEAENTEWHQGMLYVGIRYFGAKALNLREYQELVPIFEEREIAKDFNLLKQFQQVVAQQ